MGVSGGKGGGKGGGGDDKGGARFAWEDEWDRARASLPPFSSLRWVDRQLVKEWRTMDYSPTTIVSPSSSSAGEEEDDTGFETVTGCCDDHYTTSSQQHTTTTNNDNTDTKNKTSSSNNPQHPNPSKSHSRSSSSETEFDIARTFVPTPLPRPPWEKSHTCYACRQPFNNCTRLRHHCRLCGRSYCQTHSRWNHKLPHLGYDGDVPERVCGECKGVLEGQCFSERIAWRVARCRDYLADEENGGSSSGGNGGGGGALVPYFDANIDTVEDAAARLTRAALRMARSIPMGAQATVAVETLDILRRHGWKGFYGLILRKEFMAAADLLCRVTGIDRRTWPLSVHELSVAVFYALARHRAVRGADPEREHLIHSLVREEVEEEEVEDGEVDREDSGGVLEDSGVLLDDDECVGLAITSTPPPSNNENINTKDDGGDLVLWGTTNNNYDNNNSIETTSKNMVIDETDRFDPMAESVVNLLALSSTHDMTGSGLVDDEIVTDSGGGNNNKENTLSRLPYSEGSKRVVYQDSSDDGVTNSTKGIDHPPSPLLGIGQTTANSHTNNTTPSSKAPNNTKSNATKTNKLPFTPVCTPLPSSTLSSLIFYAPIAINFVYAESEVDMQLLAAQQGWRLVYANLHQDDVEGGGARTVDEGGGGGNGGVATTNGIGNGKERQKQQQQDHHHPVVGDMPANALFVHTERKIACFAIRGTATINDVVTDIRQNPVHFPEDVDDDDDDRPTSKGNDDDDDEGWTPISQTTGEGKGLALCGMAGAAYNLFRENIDTLLLFARRGYKIRLTGHSMGGSVAALMGSLVRRHFDRKIRDGDEQLAKQQQVNTNTFGKSRQQHQLRNDDDILRVYGYGSPACVDAKLSDDVQPYVTTCVLHDDVIPRLTPTSIRGLMKHLLYIRETWVKAHLANDLTAIKERAKTAWAPKVRNGFSLLLSSNTGEGSSSNSNRNTMAVSKCLKGCGKNLRKKRKSLRRKISGVGGSGSGRSKEKVSPDGGDGYSDTTTDGGTGDTSTQHEEEETTADDYYRQHTITSDNSDREQQQQHQSNATGEDDDERVAGDDEGSYYEGDCFYEAEDSLIEQSDEDVEDSTSDDDVEMKRCGHDSSQIKNKNTTSTTDNNKEEWEPFIDPENSTNKPPSNKNNNNNTIPSTTPSTNNSSPAVLLDEIPLPRMFIPGKIVHLYTHRGGYKATYVPRAFRPLRRISLASNLLNDHTSRWYYEALLEVRSIRRASHPLPEWTSFNDTTSTTCSCCASAFTWASTSDSEAQEARDKHNCRSCGGLVCEMCSKMRSAIPSVGIMVASRVCDKCYNDGLVRMGEGADGLMTRSFMEGDDDGSGSCNEASTATKGIESIGAIVFAVDDEIHSKDTTATINNNGQVGVHTTTDELERVVNSNNNNLNHSTSSSSSNTKSLSSVVRVSSRGNKSKRNIVVDELASRVKSSTFCV